MTDLEAELARRLAEAEAGHADKRAAAIADKIDRLAMETGVLGSRATKARHLLRQAAAEFRAIGA